jgi:DNA polymerase
MMQMTKPRDVLRDGRIVWWWDETRKQRLFAYCKQDVIVERRIAKAIRRLTPAERELFLLDQRINDRGILIDTPMVKAMQALVDEGLERINSRMRALTGGKVNDVNKVAQLKLWLASEDMPVGALDKDAIATLLAGDLPANLREGIELRAEGGRSSNAKLKSMINAACTDGCARGSLLYHGAGTGRWSARLIQTHNFPKGTIEDPERFLDAIMAGQYDYLNLFAPTLEIVSSNLRGCLRARPGHRLVAADYSGIEARVTNWHAGQADIVKLFADGEDVYLYNAARLFGLDLKKINKKTHFNERQIGKAIELGCGFGMGWAKLITTVAKEPYRLTWVEEEARRYVDFYRSSHQKVKDLWYATEKAAMNAVQNPGQPFSAGVNGKVTYFCAGGYLWCKLPSGRPLCYARPRIVERPVPWDKEQTRPAIEVEGVDSQTKQWIVYQLYGGILVENNVQAMARDIMAHGMTNVDKQGYPVILTSHDEVVSDVPLGFGSLADFERILCDTPAWAAGCPITSEGWEGPRYRK